MANSNNKFLNVLYNFFGVMPNPKKELTTSEKIIPIEQNKDFSKDPDPIKYKNELLQQFDYFLKQCVVNEQDLAKYENRKKLLKSMTLENTLIFLCTEMLSDEATSVQDNSNFIDVKTKNSKMGKSIIELLNKWEINQKNVKQEMSQLVTFGDCYRYRHITEKGIEGFTFLDVMDVAARLEFSPLKGKYGTENENQIATLRKNYQSIDDLVNVYENPNDDISNIFKNILIGFFLANGNLLPPWGISHTRLYSNDSEFFPYGRSMYINSLSAYLQLKASKNLMILARANNFPIEVWTLKAQENQSESEKWSALTKFIQNLNNYNTQMSFAEQKGIKSSIFTMDGLFDYKLQESRIDLGDIADIEMLELDLLRPTTIPLDLVLNKSGSGWSSGKLLLQQSKPFSRKVYSVQQAYLEQLTEDIKLHYAITQEFDTEKDEFELILQFPVIEETADVISAKKDSLEFAKTIITNMKDILGIPENTIIPENIIKEVFAKYSFLDITMIDTLVDELSKIRPDEETANPEQDINNIENTLNTDNQDSSTENNVESSVGNEENMLNSMENMLKESKISNKRNSIYQRITENQINQIRQLKESVIREIYFNTKKSLNRVEGYSNGKHYMMSFRENKETKNIISMLKNETLLKTNRLKESITPIVKSKHENSSEL